MITLDSKGTARLGLYAVKDAVNNLSKESLRLMQLIRENNISDESYIMLFNFHQKMYNIKDEFQQIYDSVIDATKDMKFIDADENEMSEVEEESV